LNQKFVINNLKIFNWNVDGVKQRFNTLFEFLNRHLIQDACISETHMIEKVQNPGLFITNWVKHFELLLPATFNLEVGIQILAQNSNIRIIFACKKNKYSSSGGRTENIIWWKSDIAAWGSEFKKIIFGAVDKKSNRNGEILQC
jgi:hypothetical protein